MDSTFTTRIVAAALSLAALGAVGAAHDLGAVVVPEAKQSPEGLKTWLAQETARYAPVIKAAGQFAD